MAVNVVWQIISLEAGKNMKENCRYFMHYFIVALVNVPIKRLELDFLVIKLLCVYFRQGC